MTNEELETKALAAAAEGQTTIDVPIEMLLELIQKSKTPEVNPGAVTMTKTTTVTKTEAFVPNESI